MGQKRDRKDSEKSQETWQFTAVNRQDLGEIEFILMVTVLQYHNTSPIRWYPSLEGFHGALLTWKSPYWKVFLNVWALHSPALFFFDGGYLQYGNFQMDLDIDLLWHTRLTLTVFKYTYPSMEDKIKYVHHSYTHHANICSKKKKDKVLIKYCT